MRDPEKGTCNTHLNAMRLGMLRITLFLLDHLVVDVQQFIKHGVDIRFAIDNKAYIIIANTCEEVIVMSDQITELDAGNH